MDSNIYLPSAAPFVSYLQDSAPAPTWAGAPMRDVRLAVAADAMNQVLTSFWGAGFLDQSVNVQGGDYAGLGTLFDRIDVNFRLPPVLVAQPNGGGLKVEAGDVEVSFVKKNNGVDQVVTRLSISAESTFTMTVGLAGAYKLASSDPVVWLDILAEGVTGSNPFDKATFKELASFAARKLVGVIGSIVEKHPIPSFEGASVANGVVTTGDVQGGYLLVSGDLQLQ
jgi:hypothetical protein